MGSSSNNCNRMWSGVGRRHHFPPANLFYSVVCVFPAAGAGRSLRGLTLFGAEWCCCLVLVLSNSGCCCFCCYRFGISVPASHVLARRFRGIFRGVYPDVFPALLWGSSTLESKNGKRVGEIPRHNRQFCCCRPVVLTAPFSSYLSLPATASGCFRRRGWLRTIPRRYEARLVKLGEGLAF